MSRFARHKDASHKPVVATFRALGCSVVALDATVPGVPDLAVGISGSTELVEVKNPVAKGTETKQTKQSVVQAEWAARWRGAPVHVVRSVDEVVALVTRLRNAKAAKPASYPPEPPEAA